jgi:hypothetical protein
LIAGDIDELDFLSLSELVERASAAAPNDRIRYRDAIASHGVLAIEALRPWLLHPELRFPAARWIRVIGARGGKSAARKALQDALAEAPPEFIGFLREELAALGVVAPVLPTYPPGTKLTPIGGGAGVHHVLLDTIPSTKTPFKEVLLVACGWFFSGKWLREQGGLLSTPTGPGCVRCEQAMEREGH